MWWQLALTALTILSLPGLSQAQMYNVTFVKAVAIELCENSDEYYFKLDAERQRDVNKQDGGGNYWRFGGDRPTTRPINVKCLSGKASNSSFVIEAHESEGAIGDRDLGSFKATLQKADSKIKLVFENKAGLIDSGRMVEGGQVFWYATLKRPDRKPGIYKHIFQITANVDQ